MWPGPYGDGGSRKYLLASLDQSLRHIGLDCRHLLLPPLRSRHPPGGDDGGTGDRRATGQGALCRDLSYSSARTTEAARLLADAGVPLLIHQPSYSMVNRWIEDDRLLDTLEAAGAGCIAFSPLAQGMLTDRYLDGIPADSRVATGGALSRDMITEDRLAQVRALTCWPRERGQSLAQMALAWALRDPRMTSLVIGASSVAQLEANFADLRTSRSATTSSAPSTSTPPTPASTSGRPPAASDYTPARAR